MIKIDLKKAHDSEEWKFVEEMQLALNFSTKFIRWIIVYNYYQIHHNSECRNIWWHKTEKKPKTRRPNILMAVCYMHGAFVKKYGACNRTRGFSYHPKYKCIKLTYLWFANDVLLFCKGEFPGSDASNHGAQNNSRMCLA